MSKAKNKGVKLELFLVCGKVDMYDMKKYSKDKLTLHHYPPFRETGHTIFEESYLLTRKNHDYIEEVEKTDPIKYEQIMEKIENNKRKLMRSRNEKQRQDF